MRSNLSETILALVISALDDLSKPNSKLSAVIHKCIRIARLRNDYEHLYWLEEEMKSTKEKDVENKVLREIAPHYEREALKDMRNRVINAYIIERQINHYDRKTQTVDEDKICICSVQEIEDSVEYYHLEASGATPPNGLHPVDLYFIEKQYRSDRTFLLSVSKEYTTVLRKIENRVHDFLSLTEKQLLYGQINADVFESNRRYVDGKLNSLSPEAFNQFVAAYQRSRELTPESRSQAVLSCRRILKTIADNLYPASAKPVKCSDGIERVLTDDKYISRLWQYIYVTMGKSSSRDLLTSQISDVGNRIDHLYELSSKGVHADVDEFELNQCIIQTYITIGDILRIADRVSAVQQ